MGQIIIQNETILEPITLIGKMAGICWGANVKDSIRNYKRGLGCIKSNHGRTIEFPDVYMVLDGYSARVIREFYTHIGGAPTRLQASTRYIDYEHGFDSICPSSIKNNKEKEAWESYTKALREIKDSLQTLDACGVPREDSAMLLPLGMTTKIVVKINARTLMDMSRQRMCSRAYWEFRELFWDIYNALCKYSEEWRTLVTQTFMAKCDACGYCIEEKCCGKHPSKEEFFALAEEGKKFRKMIKELQSSNKEDKESYYNIIQKYI